MKQLCEKCVLYDKQYDELRRKWNDTGDPELHFCPLYPDGIPKKIWDGKSQCEVNTDGSTL